MENLKTFESFSNRHNKFNKEDLQKLADQAKQSMVIFAESPIIYQEKEANNSRHLYADLEDLQNQQETLGLNSVFLTDDAGGSQEVDFDNISWIEIDGENRISPGDLASQN